MYGIYKEYFTEDIHLERVKNWAKFELLAKNIGVINSYYRGCFTK